jgi:hypothetical protein
LIYLFITLCIVGYFGKFLDLSEDPEVGSMVYKGFAFPGGYVLAPVFGILGSIVSIFFRLSEFETLAGKSRIFLMLTGAFLPITGSIFAVVIYATFQAGIFKLSVSDVSITQSTDLKIAILVGFLCGFSERFARGTLEKIAGASAAAAPVPNTK